MKPDVVVDVGNSRIKWGLCREDKVTEFVSLPLNDPDLWAAQLWDWELPVVATWAASGVNPRGMDRLIRWLEARNARVSILSSYQQLPLSVQVDAPEKVGIDRLLNAIAARKRAPSAAASIIIDAGSAVTVDCLDESGAFRGGAIFPGIRLMAKALHDYTAQLPVVELSKPSIPTVPGANTKAAIEAGIFWAVAGGIKGLLGRLTDERPAQQRPVVFLTGGDARLLEPVMDPGFITWPEMTLEGIRLSAEKLP